MNLITLKQEFFHGNVFKAVDSHSEAVLLTAWSGVTSPWKNPGLVA